LVSSDVTNNVVEENTVTGNSNGIYVAAGVQGNLIRGNLVTGNPSVQVLVDNPSTTGVDIRDLSSSGANAFEGNTCLTSLNALCPSVGPSLSASPNPIPVAVGASAGSATINWIAPGTEAVEIHIGGPAGKLLAEGGDRGSAQTGVWVTDGMTFYLQDVTNGKPLTGDYTLATFVVNLEKK
jgi:parallel beta-helix repeat protein